MWRTSNASTRSSRRAGGRRGFSLIEAVVSLFILVVVMVMTFSLLSSMSAFAERQATFTLPRQSARRAASYLTYYLAGASDLNFSRFRDTPNLNSPAALITSYRLNGAVVQSTYNNLTGAETGNAVTVAGKETSFGDLGTDVVTVAFPESAIKIRIVEWTTAGLVSLNYAAGCDGSGGEDAANLSLFKTLTGDGPGARPLLPVLGDNGRWTYLQIKTYLDAVPGTTGCSEKAKTPPKVIQVQTMLTADAGFTTADPVPPVVTPPAAGTLPPELVEPIVLLAGVRHVSFRVKGSRLEQKAGLFDPNQDNPYPADPAAIRFLPIMEDVEDFQLSYLFDVAGELRQQGGDPLAGGLIAPVPRMSAQGVVGTQPCDSLVFTSGQVERAGLPPPAECVIGMRMSLTTRSRPLSLSARSQKTVRGRPKSEDHPKGPDDVIPNIYDRYHLTTTLILRNRLLGY